jgi:hypothetical protein
MRVKGKGSVVVKALCCEPVDRGFEPDEVMADNLTTICEPIVLTMWDP